MKNGIRIAALWICLISSGCIGILNGYVADRRPPARPYRQSDSYFAATRADVDIAKQLNSQINKNSTLNHPLTKVASKTACFTLIGVDMPISIAFDTALIPVFATCRIIHFVLFRDDDRGTGTTDKEDKSTSSPPVNTVPWETSEISGHEFELVDSNRVEQVTFSSNGVATACFGTTDAMCGPIASWRLSRNGALIIQYDSWQITLEKIAASSNSVEVLRDKKAATYKVR